jgi:transposase
MKISRVGVDLAKDVYQLHGTDHKGKTLWKRKLSRSKWLSVLYEHVKPGAIIGMEACTGSHHWGRILRDAGYEVKIIPPNFVTTFVKSNKNDANDAQAICEAMMRPGMYPVAIKTVDQQDIQATHRVREDIKTHRVAKANQIRGLVAEYGVVAPQSLTALRKAIPEWLEDASNGLTVRFRQLLHGLWQDLLTLDERMKELDHQVTIIAQENPTARRLQQVQGIGPLIATALVGTLGDGKQYRKGRDMAAAIGLTPKQHSSGGKQRLLGISKRGDSYLRSLLIHGGRAAMRYAENKEDRISQWITRLRKRKHPNVVSVAMANKLARIAWVIMSKEVEYDPKYNVA